MLTAVLVTLAAAVLGLAVLVVGLLRAYAEVLQLLKDNGIRPAVAGATTSASAASTTNAATAATAAGALTADLDLPRARPGLAPLDGPGAFPAGVDIVGTSPTGDALALGVSNPDTHLLLAFLSSQCLTCQHFWQALRKSPALPGGVEVVVVTKGPEQEIVAEVARLAPPGVDVVMTSAAWRDYEVPVSPYFVHVLGGRVVGTGAASRWSQVVDLLTVSLRAGLRPATTGWTGGRLEPRAASDRAADTDAELLAAGITPGDPRLWPTGGGA